MGSESKEVILMKKASLVTIIASSAALGMLAIGATTFAASPPPASPAAKTSHVKAEAHGKMMRHRGRVTAVTATTVTVRYHGKHHHTFTLSQTVVRALAYPASPSLLHVGSPVLAFHNQIVLLPVARGVLTAGTNGQWTLVTPKHGTLSLSSAPSTLLGLSNLTNNTKVMVFGQRSGTTLTPTAVAAEPTRVRATVVSNQNGILTVKTATTPSMTITEAKLPMAKWLGKVKAGRHVVVVLDPVTKTPLAVMPEPHRSHQRFGRFAVGKLASDSTSSLMVTNPLGTETVNLSGKTVKVVWPHHASATLGQVPKGTPILVHATKKNMLVVRVF